MSTDHTKYIRINIEFSVISNYLKKKVKKIKKKKTLLKENLDDDYFILRGT